MKRVTLARPDASGAFKSEDGTRYSVQSGMWDESRIASTSSVWTPRITDEGVELGPQASPAGEVGVCYHNISQSLQWLGLVNSNH